MLDMLLGIAGSPLFIVLATIITISTIANAAVFLFCTFTGLLKPLYRLGYSRFCQEIYLIGEAEETHMIYNDLLYSKVAPRKGKLHEVTPRQLADVSAGSIVIICATKMDDDTVLKTFDKLTGAAGVVVYTEGRLSPLSMLKLNEHRRASLVNMRGRLVNEILALYVTTPTPKGA